MRYSDYTKQPDTITIHEMDEIWNCLLDSIDLRDEDCKELFEDFLKSAVQYANERGKWNVVYTRQERIEYDAGRTGIHNSVITKLNILSRYVDKIIGKDISWRDRLGDETHRKRIGDFACYVAFIYAINSR